MNPWLTLTVLSVLAGGISAYLIRSWWAICVGGAVPWLGLLGLLLYYEYFVPYSGGGASMWPIAQLFAGTVAAAVGASTAAIIYSRIKKKQNKAEMATPRKPSD